MSSMKRKMQDELNSLDEIMQEERDNLESQV